MRVVRLIMMMESERLVFPEEKYARFLYSIPFRTQRCRNFLAVELIGTMVHAAGGWAQSV